MDNTTFLTRDFIRGDSKLEVVKELAIKSLEGKFRKDGTPEINHSLLVCNLVDWFGHKENSEPAELQLQKAVALLHDMIEESKDYRPAREQLDRTTNHDEKQELARQLRERIAGELMAAFRAKAGSSGLTPEAEQDLKAWSDKVSEGVIAMTHLTHPDRFEKVDEARKIAPLWKPVRSCDQAASMIGDILHFNRSKLENFDALDERSELKAWQKNDLGHISSAPPVLQLLAGLEGNQTAALKAIDVSRALSSDNDPYHTFNMLCYSAFVKIYDSAYKRGNVVAAAEVQKAFNIEDALKASFNARTAARVSVDVPRVIHYTRDPLEKPEFGGVTDIVVREDDPSRVVRFSMWEGDGVVDKDWAKKGMRGIPNAATLSNYFVQRLERMPGVKLNTGYKDRHVREFAVNDDPGLPNNKPLELLRFLKAAAAPGAIDSAYVRRIRDEQQAVADARAQEGDAAPPGKRSSTYSDRLNAPTEERVSFGLVLRALRSQKQRYRHALPYISVSQRGEESVSKLGEEDGLPETPQRA